MGVDRPDRTDVFFQTSAWQPGHKVRTRSIDLARAYPGGGHSLGPVGG